MHRVALPDADVTRWSVGEYVKTAGLSVTDSHTVLVTYKLYSEVQEFRTDGRLLREFELPNDVIPPIHAVRLLVHCMPC